MILIRSCQAYLISLDDTVPAGKDESDNVEIRKWGRPGTFDFEIKDHVDLGETNNWMDFETASKITGSRFVVLNGSMARFTPCTDPVYAQYTH